MTVRGCEDSGIPAPLSGDERERAIANLQAFEGQLDPEKFKNLLVMAFSNGVINEHEYHTFMGMTMQPLIDSIAVELKIEIRRALERESSSQPNSGVQGEGTAAA